MVGSNPTASGGSVERRPARRRFGLWAVAAVTLAYLMMAQGGSWNPDAHYALVRALAEGTPRIDNTQYEAGGTGDFSIIDGHYYSAKSPGLAFATMPAYLVLKAAGGAPAFDGNEATLTRELWFLTIWGAVLPALVLLLLVYFVAGGLVPGYGPAAAVTLGVATMVLPFATLFFSHSLSSMLVFAAFAVLWRERAGPPRLSLVLAAGVLAGLAATTDFSDAVPGAVVGLYALVRYGRVPRALAYGAGAVIGGLPTLLFNQWAFGSAFTFSYTDLNSYFAQSAGFFDITRPSFRTAAELLLSPVGLLTLMPVLAIGAYGAVLIYRGGHKAEALLIAGVSLSTFLLITSKQDVPLGGNTPGPRYLMPMLPFLALGIAAAYRRLPITTLVLAAASTVQMVVITMTHPLFAPLASWFHRLATGDLSKTAPGMAGAQDLGIAVFLVALALGVAFAAVATPKVRLSSRDALSAVLALGGWLLFDLRGPALLKGHALGNGAASVFVFAAFIAAVAAAAPRIVFWGSPIKG